MKNLLLILISVFIGFSCYASHKKMEIYQAPKGVMASPDFTVSVLQEGVEKESFVYYSTPLDNDADNATAIQHQVVNGINKHPILREFYFKGQPQNLDTKQSCSYTCFSFAGKVKVRIKGNKIIESFKILPSSAGIKGKIDGSFLEFELVEPQKLGIVLNGDYLNPLFLFADAPEQGIPDKSSSETLVIKAGDDCRLLKDKIKHANVVWFEPGVHHIGISFPVYANQTLYLEGGSYLLGTISGFMASNVTIRGRGILAGDSISRQSVRDLKVDRQKNNWNRLHYHAINMLSEQNKTSWNAFADYPGSGCDNLTIEGITIASPRQFFIRATGVPITIYNVKMVGSWPYNTDGFSGIGQANTTVFDCFFHCNDDAIYVTPNNCHVHHCNFWQGNNGCVFQFAWGSAPISQGGGYVHDCNVLHCGHVEEANNRMIFGSRKSGSGDIENVHFKNINIEGPVWSLIRLETNGDGDLGSFRNITFENIHVDGPILFKSKIASSKGRAEGATSESWIKNIKMKNLIENGRIMNESDFIIDNFQVENIHFE